MSPPTVPCPVCGRPVARNSVGRPRVFCDDECKALAYWLADVEPKLAALALRCTPMAWARARAVVWGALNLRAWNRGVPRVAGKGRRAPWVRA